MLAALLAVATYAWAQAPAKVPPPAPPAEQQKADAHKLPAEKGEVVDRLVAIVNGDIVLESDVDEELRYSHIYPFRTAGGTSEREQAINRLIDRRLILQQESGLAIPPVPDADVDQAEQDLRADAPACIRYKCTTDAGWKKFLTDNGFTEAELRLRLRQRTETLSFIEQRFRSAANVSDDEIQKYYDTQFVPQFTREHATAPPLDDVSDRISEILLQEKVSALLEDWLKTLRASGRVQVLQPEGPGK